MSETSILVSLKAPDPAAMTALSTLMRISPGTAPLLLSRYDHWRFTGPGAGREFVSELVSHYTDIVNPNKQIWSFFEGETDPILTDPGMTWVAVLVTDRVDSISENWTGILGRNHRGVESVGYSVLWRLGFHESISLEEARGRTMTMAVTTHRDRGLLANPVSQLIELLGTSKT